MIAAQPTAWKDSTGVKGTIVFNLSENKDLLYEYKIEFATHSDNLNCTMLIGLNPGYHGTYAQAYEKNLMFYAWGCQCISLNGETMQMLNRTEVVSLKTGEAFLIAPPNPVEGKLLSRQESWAYNSDLIPDSFQITEPWINIFFPDK